MSLPFPAPVPAAGTLAAVAAARTVLSHPRLMSGRI